MKRQVLLTALLLSMFLATGVAQVPQVINYQGKLVDNAGDPVPDAGYQITFTIYEDAGGTTSRWSSGSAVVDVEDGLFCYALGSAVPFPNDLFEDTLRWLGISVSGDPEILPRTKLTSAAYAYHALRADTAATVEVPLELSGDYTYGGIVSAENTGLGVGVWGSNSLSGNYAYLGSQGSGVTAIAAAGVGVWGESSDVSGSGVLGQHVSGNYGFLGTQSHAGYFGGPVQVDGTAQMTGFSMLSGAVDGYVLTSDGSGTGTWQPPSGGGGGGWVDDGATVRLETISDQVGIGTSSPSAKLDVAGTARMTGFSMPTGASNSYVLTADAAGTGSWQPAPGGISGSGTVGYVPKFQTTTSLANSGIIDIGGNIGIGTNAPGSHRLLVTSASGGVAGATAFLENTSTSGIALIAENNSSDLTLLASQLGSGSIFRCDSYTGGWHPVFTVQNDGRTLIGSSAAPAGLELYGDAIFYDSTMRVDANGIRVGDGGTPSMTAMMAMDRTYSFSSSSWRYGINIDVENKGTGYMCGLRAEAGDASSLGGVGCNTYGVMGRCYTDNGDRRGVYGYSTATYNTNEQGDSYGLYGHGWAGDTVYGVYGFAEYGNYAYGVYGRAQYADYANYAGYFQGNVTVTGTLSKGGGSFKIDHPLDPENKYLYHSFVESPDMMNVYNGNIVLDDRGEAAVQLPDYFGALNKDFRYQLTAIGAPGPNLYVAEEISGNSFTIAGGAPGMKVSWQVTGVRKDAFAEANRIQVEVDKPEVHRGLYIHPEAFGLSEEKSIHYEHNRKIEQARLAESEENQR
ncbi:MAG: hypothetical protein OEW00_05585 [candidate division Zixibacteria bacterium]|nr:hypothetical protein [candidate division Zixibacteria bacterium]